jgi:hypothetical protein
VSRQRRRLKPPCHHLRPGERVRIVRGGAKGCTGEVVSLDGLGGWLGPFVRVRLDEGQREKGEGTIREAWCERLESA